MSDLQGVLAARVIMFTQVGEELLPVGGGRETEAELVDDPIPRQDVLLGLPQRRLLLLQLLFKQVETQCNCSHCTLSYQTAQELEVIYFISWSFTISFFRSF